MSSLPNHVTNILRVPPEVADAFTTTEDGERQVDFSLVVPTPEGYDADGCSHSHPLNYDPRDPHANCWYSWNREFWGTKWNAYDTRVTGADGDGATVTFLTAWSHPAPVIVALSKKFPLTAFVVEYADEDFGSNVARYRILDGERYDIFAPAPGSDEANELAASILYGRPYADLRAEWDADEAEFQRRYDRQQAIKADKGCTDQEAWEFQRAEAVAALSPEEDD